MKKQFILLLLSVVILASCSKDDSKKKSDTDINTFSINGTEYDINLTQGFYFESTGLSGDDLYNFQVGGNSTDDFNISFGICWKNTTDNVDGNFMKRPDFGEPGWNFECSNIDISATEFEEFATGLLVVTQISGSTYRVEFDGTTDAGSSVAVFLEQSIIIIDD